MDATVYPHIYCSENANIAKIEIDLWFEKAEQESWNGKAKQTLKHSLWNAITCSVLSAAIFMGFVWN